MPPSPPPAVTTCPICRADVNGQPQPQLITMFVAVLPGGALANVPVHLVCFADLVAGRVVQQLQQNDTDDSGLGDVVGGIVGEIIARVR